MPIHRIALYVRDPERTMDFYTRHFGFQSQPDDDGGLTELICPDGGTSLLILQAAKSVKVGQVTVKLIFDIENIEEFKQISARSGLVFGSTHKTDGYEFANAKDPDNNNISISSRAFRK
jgi:predicted enzyme related to lactoylglutathione lyase